MKHIKVFNSAPALVDDEDFEWLNKHRWHPTKKGYAMTAIRNPAGSKTRQTHALMHRMIMRPPADLQIDHINGNARDNRRQNLRIVVRHQNAQNCRKRKKPTTSKYRGVSWDKQTGKWRSEIRAFVGFFDDEKEAARAWNEVAQKLHGQYARVNII